MKIIYVAGPYTDKNNSIVTDNIIKAEKVSLHLLRLGWCVITPHKNFAHYNILDGIIPSFDYLFWKACCLELLNKCDAVYFLKNWEKSYGCMLEMQKCRELQLDIYHEGEGYPMLWTTSEEYDKIRERWTKETVRLEWEFKKGVNNG